MLWFILLDGSLFSAVERRRVLFLQHLDSVLLSLSSSPVICPGLRCTSHLQYITSVCDLDLVLDAVSSRNTPVTVTYDVCVCVFVFVV